MQSFTAFWNRNVIYYSTTVYYFSFRWVKLKFRAKMSLSSVVAPVGAGSAGSVVANRLSELSCVNVLLLEAGKPTPLLTEIPAVGRAFVFTDIDWKYRTVPQIYTASAQINNVSKWPPCDAYAILENTYLLRKFYTFVSWILNIAIILFVYFSRNLDVTNVT